MLGASSTEGFDAFYRDGSARLARQIFAFTNDPAEALDVVQEAYVRAWTRWERVAHLDDPHAWVRRVAFNLAKNSNRRRRRFSEQPLPQQVVEEDPGDRSRLELAAALSTLSPEHRQALVLHYLLGLTNHEIATEMGVPIGTVKSWLSRGRLHLSAALDALEATDDCERTQDA